MKLCKLICLEVGDNAVGNKLFNFSVRLYRAGNNFLASLKATPYQEVFAIMLKEIQSLLSRQFFDSVNLLGSSFGKEGDYTSTTDAISKV